MKKVKKRGIQIVIHLKRESNLKMIHSFVDTSGKDIEYLFYEKDSTITFLYNLSYSYEMKKISEDKIVLKGLSSIEGRSCVLERIGNEE